MNYQMLVNKENPLEADYVPKHLVEYLEYNGPKIDINHKTYAEFETMKAFFEMKEEAKKLGYNVILDSGYRSYEYQEKILKDSLSKLGAKAYLLVAPPGCSEHQTGLAIDVAFNINGEYIDEFDDTLPEIKWLHDNCYKYGFILRYPKGKEDITGYNYECWHFRYVGKELAQEMHIKNIETLEEYYEMINDKEKIK